MKKLTIFLLTILCANTIFAQSPPAWLDLQQRKTEYPNNAFFTGFASDEILAGENQNTAIARVTELAQGYVAENVRVEVNVATEHRATSKKTEETEAFNSIFEKTVKTIAKIELTGLTTESYVAGNTIYAFAFVNKYELKGNYSAIFNMNMQQLESILHTAKQLEATGDKAKARTQYEAAVPVLAKVEQAQDVLSALGGANLQSEKTANYRSDIILALARLAQGIYIYVENNEDLFGQKVDIVAHKVKAVLAANGCSFTENEEHADFTLRISVTTRASDNPGTIVFCYTDTAIELYDNHKQKIMYSDEIAQKGGSNSLEKAGRQAMSDTATKISEKLLPWIK